jgi:CelD/BcsL family acetyltransferase involved in cellulose biosynthesis
MGKPVGGRLSDFQGVIAPPGLEYTAADLVRSCGLAAWDFDHLVTNQGPFVPYHYGVAGSRYMDLSGGFEAFLAQCTKTGTRTFKELMRKRRKLEREHGEVHFQYHTTAPAVVQTLMAWKRDQYRRTHVTDVFAYPWTVRLIEQLLDQPQEWLEAKLSALYAGDRLVAIELGLRSGTVLHGWFPAYDLSFGHYSPGLLLLLEIAREAADRGVRRLDMGKGPGQYKEAFTSGTIPLAEGSVTLGSLLRLTRRGTHRVREWARGSQLGLPVRALGRFTRSVRGWLAFR